ncbi:hypothetical protein ONE63_002711 [Megalurothrips usitatus]|uniref:Uncharacterized protein n=1 Tax=Megalurothrips usitatus TaxID=439358 RepID=A0AAV7XBA1_9NEOP|nr:hypothetical protein ONE63_002711 [Megalurothrips usitatus]
MARCVILLALCGVVAVGVGHGHTVVSFSLQKSEPIVKTCSHLVATSLCDPMPNNTVLGVTNQRTLCGYLCYQIACGSNVCIDGHCNCTTVDQPPLDIPGVGPL